MYYFLLWCIAHINKELIELFPATSYSKDAHALGTEIS